MLTLALCRQYLPNCQRSWYTSERLRTVTLKPFIIDRTEVTNQQFAEFVRQTGYETVAEKRGKSKMVIGGRPFSVPAPGLSWRQPNGKSSSYQDVLTNPVVHVTYADAERYCSWAGGRLPTEEEWEYAARGAERHVFPWGDNWDTTRVIGGNSGFNGPAPVGSRLTGATPNGIVDMAGNVWEWTSSSDERGKMLKGGSWVDRNPANFRAAVRLVADPKDSFDDSGFRCVRDSDNWQVK